MDIQTALQRLNAKPAGHNKWRAACPAHNGDDRNMEIRDDGGTAYFTCYSHGCDYKDILAALGEGRMEERPSPVAITPPEPEWPPFDGEPVKQKPTKQQSKIVATYDYHDENGDYIFSKLRLEPKSFRIKRGEEWGIGDARRVLYNLPSITVADEVWIVEGEKDADRLTELGLVATCNFDGASMPNQKPKWLDEYNQHLAGKTVYIIPDNDEQGDAHASYIYKQLRDIAKSVKVVELPDLPPHGDVSDWLNAGGTLEQLREMAQQAEPPKHRWNILSLADVPDMPKPTQYVIDPILPESSLNVWYGASGSGKSMLIMDMAFSILSEGKFIAGNVPEMYGNKKAVLWLDMDNGGDVMIERIAAFRRTRNVPNDAPFHYVVMPEPWPFLADVNSQMDLETAVMDLNIGVLVIDNLGSISGDIDENSAQMVRIMAPLRRLAEKTRCAIIVIHHPRKGGANGGRAGEALRGHSVIEASLDYAVFITKDEQSNITRLSCTKARRFRFDDIQATFNVQHHDGTNDLSMAWYTTPVWKRGQNDVKDTIMDVVVEAGEITQTRLIDHVYDILDRKASKPKIKSFLDEMLNIDFVLVAEKGDYNANVIKKA